MTQDGGDNPYEPVGSVAEEAAKLFSALAGWAGEQGGQYAQAAAGAASAASHAVHDLNDHISTGSKDCTYCPVCQAISFVRGTSPEVKANLMLAANSFVQAAAGMLATQVPPSATSPVEKINLDDDS